MVVIAIAMEEQHRMRSGRVDRTSCAGSSGTRSWDKVELSAHAELERSLTMEVRCDSLRSVGR